MNQHLPILKPRDLLRALGRAGFFIHHTSGSHYILKHPDHPRSWITLPYHNKDLKRKTLLSILEQAGLTVAQLRELL